MPQGPAGTAWGLFGVWDPVAGEEQTSWASPSSAGPCWQRMPPSLETGTRPSLPVEGGGVSQPDEGITSFVSLTEGRKRFVRGSVLGDCRGFISLQPSTYCDLLFHTRSLCQMLLSVNILYCFTDYEIGTTNKPSLQRMRVRQGTLSHSASEG